MTHCNEVYLNRRTVVL